MSMDSSNSLKKTKMVGIVTRGVELGAGKSLICVWNSRSPLKEYKFPRWADEYSVWFNWGEIVWIEPTKCVDEVQDPKNICKLEPDSERLRKIEVTYPIGHDSLFLIKVLLTFPSPLLDYYSEEVAAAKSLGCRAIGWTVEMGKVALLDESLNFQPGVCYSAYVARISPDKDWIAEKMGTIWVVDGSAQLTEVNNSEAISRMQQRIPWKNSSFGAPLIGSSSAIGNGNSTSSPFFDALPSPSLSQHHLMSSNASSAAPPTAPPQRSLMLSNDWTDDFEDPLRNASCSVDSRVSHMQQQQMRTNADSFLPPAPPSSAYSSSKHLMMQQQQNQHSPSLMDEQQQRRQPSQQQLSLLQHDVDMTTTNNRENVLFGNLIALKLESIHARNPNAAIQLQKAVMDLCSDYELKLINAGNNNSGNPYKNYSGLGNAFGSGIGRD